MNWEEIFTSNSPSGVGRVINVVAGAAAIGSDASPYTSNSPSGTGRAINVNIVSGGAGAGVLQLQNNAPLDTTLRSVTDQANTVSPLQLSTTQVQVESAVGAIFNINSGSGYGSLLNFKTNNVLRAYMYSDSSELSIVTASTQPIKFLTNVTERGRFTSTGDFVLGTTTASARLHVRGDGTNPVGRFESSAGLNFFTVNNSGQTIWGSAGANEPYIVNYNGTSTESGSGNALRIRQRANINGTLIQYWADGLFNNTTSGDNIAHHFLASGYAGAAGNGNFRMAQFNYTINNSGVQSGVATGIYLRATETALNSMAHNFIDLGTAAAGSLFSVTNVGAIKVATIADASAPNSSLYFSSTASRLVWKDAGGVVNNLY